MHFFAYIPFVAVLASAAFVAISAVWDANRRASGSMTEIFLCLFGWALIDLFGQVEPDPESALFWLRLVHLPALLLSTCVVRLMIEMVPAARLRLQPLAHIGFALALGAGVLGAFVPGVVSSLTPLPWGGWQPRFGFVSMLLVPIGCLLPAIAAHRIRDSLEVAVPNPSTHLDRLRSRAVTIGVSISVAAALSTEYLFPILELPVPKLGALITVLASAALWLHLLRRSDDLAIAPQATARAVLTNLQDGVALVEMGGTILTANPRLAALVDRDLTQIVGRSFAEFVKVPIDSLRCGLDEREIELETDSGQRIPVSISSACVRNRRGHANWFVVVFRDLRSVDVLRRRLLTSGRLAAVGELAAGIAHEVNNPVAFIRSDLNFLRGRLDEIEAQFSEQPGGEGLAGFFEGGAARIDSALEGIERIAQVVADVRGFAHVGAQGVVVGEPGAILESAVRLARLERRDEVALTIEKAELFQPVRAGQDFKQVIVALLRVLTVASGIGAAIRIVSEPVGPALRIELETDDLDTLAEAQIHRFESARANVLDAPAADLGLALAIELVDQSGGSVEASAAGRDGLRIVLTWPFDQEGCAS